MIKPIKIVLYGVQISIIICAVILSVLRFGTESYSGLEPIVKNWFEEQGINANFEQISLKINGATPQINLSNIDLSYQQSKINLRHSVLGLNVRESIKQQKIVFDTVSLYLSKATINTDSLLQDPAQNDILKVEVPPQVRSLIKTIVAFGYFKFHVDEVTIESNNFSTKRIFNTELILAGQTGSKILELRSGLFDYKKQLLYAQLKVNDVEFSSIEKLKGQGYLDLKVETLEKYAAFFDFPVTGNIKWQSWFGVNGRSLSFINQINLKRFALNKQPQLKLDSDVYLAGAFNNQNLDVNIQTSHTKLNNQKLNPVTAHIHSDLVKGELHKSQFFINQLKVSDFTYLWKNIQQNDFPKLISKLSAQGTVNNIYGSFEHKDKKNSFGYSLLANNLSWKTVDQIPGVKNIQARISGNKDALSAKLVSKRLVLNLPQLFSQQQVFTDLSSNLSLRFEKDQFELIIPEVEFKQDQGKIVGRASVLKEHSQASPYFLARFHVENATEKVAKLSYPDKIMDDDVLQWLKEGLQQVSATGDVLYAGRLENGVDFGPSYSGIFNARVYINKLKLLYDTEWPLVNSSNALAEFENNGLFITSPKANSEHLEAELIEVTIANFLSPRLGLKLTVKDQVQNQWKWMAKTPLTEIIPYYSDISKPLGKSQTKVDVEIPLESEDFDIRYNIGLKTNNLGFDLDALGINLSKANGDVLINNEGVTIVNMNANWYGQAMQLSSTNLKSGDIHFKIDATDLDVSSIKHYIPDDIGLQLKGKSTWRFNLKLNPNTNNRPLFELTMNSNLEGTSIYLPEPIFKPEEDVEPLKAKIIWHQNKDLDLALTLSDRFKTNTKWVRNDRDELELLSSMINFGAAPLAQSLPQGIIITGEMNKLNIDQWATLFNKESNTDNPSIYSKVNNINVDIEQLTWKGITAQKVHLYESRVNGGVSGKITSSITEGEYFIPSGDLLTEQIKIDLEWINYQLSEKSEESDYSKLIPSDLPSLILNVKTVELNGMKFNAVKLNLGHEDVNSLQLNELNISFEKLNLNAAGNWIYDPLEKQHDSRIFIGLKDKDFGTSLTHLNLGDALKEGELSFESELFWDKGMLDFKFKEAVGKATFKLKDGFLKNVEPGSGRFVGLLSLSALPRRLSLDFSDFLKEGLEYKSIKGDFDIHDGSLWTSNLIMKGVSSTIKLDGRTGVSEQDYDQIITITPKIRDSLPLLGTLVSGSQAGWALLLFQKIFKKPIDDSVTINYKMTGSWDDPIIKVIRPSEPEESEITNDER